MLSGLKSYKPYERWRKGNACGEVAQGVRASPEGKVAAHELGSAAL